jgi:hypothetical protein
VRKYSAIAVELSGLCGNVVGSSTINLSVWKCSGIVVQLNGVCGNVVG